MNPYEGERKVFLNESIVKIIVNIIVILTDQQRADSCGCYGQILPVTPNLDSMAQEGTLFENAFTVQPICGPARACIQTGLYATQNKVYFNSIRLRSELPTIATHLSVVGYQTAYIGKWHLASTRNKGTDLPEPPIVFRTKPVPLDRRGGFNEIWLAADALECTSHSEGGYIYDRDNNRVDFGGYRVDRITDFALDFLENRDKTRPFLLFLSYLEPHHQNDRHRFEGPPGSKEKFGEYFPPIDLQGLKGDWQSQFPDYLGCCWSIDQNLARIRNTLTKSGLTDNTLILFTSDHGCHFRTRNAEYKRSAHDASIKIPLIAYGPGFIGGKKRTKFVTLLDILPTILTACDITVPSHLPGKPLQDIMNPSNQNPTNTVLIQISESQVGRAIRTERWKFSVKARNKKGAQYHASDEYEEDLLYDLSNDSGEHTNLIQDPRFAKIRIELKQLLIEKMMEAGEKAPTIIPKQSRWKNFKKKWHLRLK